MTYYVVYKGKSPGIYESWTECEFQVKGYSGAVYKKFKDIQQANEFLNSGENMNTKTITKTITKKNVLPVIKLEDNNTYVYTDGSLIRKNNAIYGGYGIYIPTKRVEKSCILSSPKTNNRGEMTAIIEGILCCDINDNIKIYTDSKYSILICTGTGIRYKNNNYTDKDGKDVLNKDLIIILLELLEKYKVELVHIRAHTNLNDIHSIGNKKADELAVQGSKQDMTH